MTDLVARWNDMHSPAGSPTGGQFAAGGSSGGSSAAKPQAKKSGHPTPSANHQSTHATAHAAPTHTLAYDPKKNTGAGYGMPHGDPNVKQLQTKTNALGLTDLHGKSLAVDGKLGPLTTSSIKALQRRLGVKADGQVTPAFFAQVMALKTLPPPHRSTTLDGGRMDVITRAADSTPYGDVEYADTGMQPDKKKRYPIDSEAHCRAAWSYINQSDNASMYSPEQLASIKGRIKAAGKKYGISFDDAASRADLLWPALMITRSFAIDDAAVQPGRVTCEGCGQDATGRMVDAYAGVFNEPTEVSDQFGHYIEDIDPTAWNKRLADVSRSAAGVRTVNVYYNHALTAQGTPSEVASVPIGHPSAIRSDRRGLLTSTHYARDPFAQRILDGIIDGNIGGQSFTGRIIRSDPDRVPKVSRGASLPRVRRLELGLSEYGPTPQPYYAGAQTVAVRALQHPGQHPYGAAGTAPPHLPDGDAGAEEPHHALRSAQENQRRIRRFLALRGMHDGSHPARND